MNRRLHVLILIFAALVTLSARLVAQDVDSLVRVLDSPDWQDRHGALLALNRLPLQALPPSFALKAIALLEKEAVTPDPAANAPGEGYGEYLLALVDAVLRLKDPRSIRGIALLGIQTSRDAEEFVASQGAASLPYLDEAWQRDPLNRPTVVVTWGLMLGPFRDRLSRAQRLEVMDRVFAAMNEDALAFVSAAELAPLPEAVPVVEQIATTGRNGTVRGSAQAALVQLRPLRDRQSPLDLQARLKDWLDAFCENAQGARHGACQSLGNLLADATKHVQAGRTGPAKNVLTAFANRADAAFQQGALSDAEHRLLADNARYLVGRL